MPAATLEVVKLRRRKLTTVLEWSMALTAIAVLAFFALAGCGGSKTSKTQPQGTVSTMKVKAGQDFTISLQANATTGYRWQLAEPLDEKVVKKVSSEYKADQSGGENMGAGGVEIWVFNAVGKGKTDIKMEYVGPGETGAKPSEERTFQVTVE